MITARKSKWFTRIFEVYNRNLIGRKFHALHVAGLSHLQPTRADVPLLVCANHSSWWDGLIAFQLGRALRLDDYALMEERQLREHAFLQKLGAFGVVRENARDGVRTIAHAAELIRGTSRVLWIFPQGETLPNNIRPLKLYTGAARIIEKVGRVDVVTVAFRHEFLNEFKPEIFVRCDALDSIDASIGFDPKQFTMRLQEHLTDSLDRLRTEIANGETGDYADLLERRKSF